MKRAWSAKNAWELSPPWLKQTVGRVIGMMPTEYVLGKTYRSTMRFLRESERWSCEQSREYQTAQLRAVLTLAYEKTAYYRRTFDAVGFQPGDFKSIEDLARLPTIDKGVIREHLNDMCATAPDGARVDYVSTGGSQGQPLRFYIGAERSGIEYAYLVQSWKRAGYDLSFPQAVFRGQMVAESGRGLRHEYDPILRRHGYSNFHMTPQNMRQYLEHIATIGRCFLHVYPSSVSVLARFIQQTGTPVPGNIAGILAESENVYPDDRAIVERVFGVRYFSSYGHSEKLVLAAECEHSTDYHVWPTYGYSSLVDERGRPLGTPGARGEIVGSGFINRIVPFIRYRTGDFATYVGERCESCGREHMVIRDVEGRWPQGNLIAHDGAAISMTAINVHDETFEDVLAYQFYQERAGEAVLRVVPVRPLTDEQRHRIIRGMARRLQGQVNVSLQVCSELEQTRRGKQLRVVQRIPGVVPENA